MYSHWERAWYSKEHRLSGFEFMILTSAALGHNPANICYLCLHVCKISLILVPTSRAVLRIAWVNTFKTFISMRVNHMLSSINVPTPSELGFFSHIVHWVIPGDWYMVLCMAPETKMNTYTYHYKSNYLCPQTWKWLQICVKNLAKHKFIHRLFTVTALLAFNNIL